MRICVIHPHAEGNPGNKYHPVRLEELEGVEDSSCLELHLMNTADYIKYEQRKDLYNLAISKLRHGGQIIVVGNDIASIGHGLSNGLDGVEDVNKQVFNGRLSMDTIGNVRRSLLDFGLKIDAAYFDLQHTYVIKATRP